MIRILILTVLLGATAVGIADDSTDLTANSQTDDLVSGGEGTIEYIEAPTVQKVATVEVKDQRDELICRREKLTGSHRLMKICRYRSNIDATRKETQAILRLAMRR